MKDNWYRSMRHKTYASRKALAEWITGLSITSVLDLGCGTGIILERLYHKTIKGVEGFSEPVKEASSHVRPYIDVWDLNQSKQLNLGKWDLVITLEVAEHIKSEEEFFNLIGRSAQKYVIFSASAHSCKYHVNPNPKEYWSKRLKEQNLIRSARLEESLKRHLAPWSDKEFYGNIMVWNTKDL